MRYDIQQARSHAGKEDAAVAYKRRGFISFLAITADVGESTARISNYRPVAQLGGGARAPAPYPSSFSPPLRSPAPSFSPSRDAIGGSFSPIVFPPLPLRSRSFPRIFIVLTIVIALAAEPKVLVITVLYQAVLWDEPTFVREEACANHTLSLYGIQYIRPHCVRMLTSGLRFTCADVFSNMSACQCVLGN